MTPGQRDPRTSRLIGAPSGVSPWTAYLLASLAVLLLVDQGRLDAMDIGYLLGSALAWWVGHYVAASGR